MERFAVLSVLASTLKLLLSEIGNFKSAKRQSSHMYKLSVYLPTALSVCRIVLLFLR